jgi:drug/metabolite transporter (DMT)-like permease
MMPSNDTSRGVALMLLAGAVIAVSDTLVRLTTEKMPVGQFLVMRGAVPSMIFAAILRAKLQPGPWRALLRPSVVLRSVLEAGSVVSYIAALQVLMIAEVTAIYLTSPIITCGIIALVGSERVNGRRWAALILDLLGVALVTAPDLRHLSLASLPALVSAALVSFRDIVTSRVPENIPSLIVTLTTTVTVSVSGFFLLPLEMPWRAPGIPDAILLLSASIFVCLGNLLAVAAFRRGEVAVVSLFRYASLPYALLAGLLVWGELPSTSQIVGGVIVVVSGLMIYMPRLTLLLARAGKADVEHPLAAGEQPCPRAKLRKN